MSIFLRPVSEVYHPEAPHLIDDVEPDEHYQAWRYTIGYEVDEKLNSVPFWGNTAIFRIREGGMTEPVYVTKPDHHARFTVNVLAGSGVLIRALPSGATETIELEEDGEVVIEPGQAYSYVNTGKQDLLLHDVALPAFRPGDDVELLQSYSVQQKKNVRLSEAAALSCYEAPDGLLRCVILPRVFFDRIGEALAGRYKLQS